MSPNPLNVNIKYGNSEKTLKSVDTNVNFLSVNQEQLITQEKLNSLKNSSGMEKMIFLSDSEITNLALDIIFGKYSDSSEIIKSMDYYSDEIQAKINELMPIYLVVKEAADKNYTSSEIIEYAKQHGYSFEDIKDILYRMGKGGKRTDLEELRQEKIMMKKLARENSSTTVSTPQINNSPQEIANPELIPFNLKPGLLISVQKELKELSNATINKAVEEKKAMETLDEKGNPLGHIEEYRFLRDEYTYGAWCANFATWVWKNTEVDGVSPYKIARLNKDMTPSTGNLMMHFLTADHPDLGFDYSSYVYYDPEINENIAFYYNDINPEMSDRNEGKLPDGLKNYIPKPGDLVFFDNHDDRYGPAGHGELWEPLRYPDDSRQDHTGMVKEVLYNDAGEVIGIKTIEGNIDAWFKERTINFYDDEGNFNTDDVYSSGLIGYGTIIDIPSVG